MTDREVATGPGAISWTAPAAYVGGRIRSFDNHSFLT